LDLPQPLGPTIAVISPGNEIDVGSTNDLKPASLIRLRRMTFIIIFAVPRMYQ
jgi:hypothetical protein